MDLSRALTPIVGPVRKIIAEELSVYGFRSERDMLESGTEIVMENDVPREITVLRFVTLLEPHRGDIREYKRISPKYTTMQLRVLSRVYHEVITRQDAQLQKIMEEHFVVRFKFPFDLVIDEEQ